VPVKGKENKFFFLFLTDKVRFCGL